MQRLFRLQVRRLQHAGIDHSNESAETDAAAGTEPESEGRSYTWLKWTAAAVLFVEAFIGVLVPLGLKLTAHASWLLSLVNCFAGGVFFTFGAGRSTLAAQCRRSCVTFRLTASKDCGELATREDGTYLRSASDALPPAFTGIMHIGPDALEAQDAIGLDRFPLAAFLIAFSFLCIFFVHRILAPSLRLTPHLHSHYPVTTPVRRADIEICSSRVASAGVPDVYMCFPP